MRNREKHPNLCFVFVSGQLGEESTNARDTLERLLELPGVEGTRPDDMTVLVVRYYA